MSWKDDKKWSDKFLPEIKKILGQHLIGEPPFEEDQERNTDLIVLKMDAVRIGCRVRRYNYFSNYGNEFTVRAGRPSEVKTELTKIIEGWGDYFFYGFSNIDETGFIKWTLFTLNEFRLWYNRYLIKNNGATPGQKNNNTDNSSYFLAFKINDLPPSFIVACDPPF